MKAVFDGKVTIKIKDVDEDCKSKEDYRSIEEIKQYLSDLIKYKLADNFTELEITDIEASLNIEEDAGNSKEVKTGGNIL